MKFSADLLCCRDKKCGNFNLFTLQMQISCYSLRGDTRYWHNHVIKSIGKTLSPTPTSVDGNGLMAEYGGAKSPPYKLVSATYGAAMADIPSHIAYDGCQNMPRHFTMATIEQQFCVIKYYRYAIGK